MEKPSTEKHAVSADISKQTAALEQAFVNEAGALTERLIKFDNLYCQEHGLSKEQRVFAAALYCINLRESYPDGKESFDSIAASAADYYDKNA